MPAAWSRKDERQYEHILSSCTGSRKHRGMKTCKRIAAATVNKRRRREGRTLSSLGHMVWSHLGIPSYLPGPKFDYNVTPDLKKVFQEAEQRAQRRALAGLGGRLTSAQRRRLRSTQFCLPNKRKYPVPDCSHAKNALSRASAAHRRGYLSAAEYKRVRACARRAERRLCGGR